MELRGEEKGIRFLLQVFFVNFKVQAALICLFFKSDMVWAISCRLETFFLRKYERVVTTLHVLFCKLKLGNFGTAVPKFDQEIRNFPANRYVALDAVANETGTNNMVGHTIDDLALKLAVVIAWEHDGGLFNGALWKVFFHCNYFLAEPLIMEVQNYKRFPSRVVI